jgi:hypothetical protein
MICKETDTTSGSTRPTFRAVQAGRGKSRRLSSTGSFRSEICRAEQLRALRKGKRVVPLLSDRNSERPLYFEHLNYRDFSDPARFRESFQTLLADIKGGETTPLPEQRRYTTVTAPPLPINFVPRPGEWKSFSAR